MGMSSILVAPGLELPLDIVVQKTTILARSGAGKTNTAVVIVEKVLDCEEQTIILDPPGAWWGLRAVTTAADERGTEPYKILILGGRHGDMPLPHNTGAAVADFLIETRISAVLDMSEMSGKQMRGFVADFATRFYERKAEHPDPVLLVLEEADEMAPQRATPDATTMLGAIERLAKRGRMRGIGMLCITQRSASFHKDVLSQTELMIAMQTTSPHDIKALNDWIGAHGDPEKQAILLASIARLQPGEAFVWSPSWLNIFQRVRFNLRTTYDSSATPKPGSVPRLPTKMSNYDLQEFGKALQQAIETAAADDPRVLKRRIGDLERQVAELQRTKIKQRPVIYRDDIEALSDVVQRMERATAEMSGALARAAIGALEIADGAVAPVPDAPVAIMPSLMPSAPKPARTPPAKKDPEASGPKLPKAETALLLVLLQWPEGRTRSQISILSGYSLKSSSFKNALSALRSGGLIVSHGTDGFKATDAGRARLESLGITIPPPPTGEVVLGWWMEKLPRAEAVIFSAIMSEYRATVTTPLAPGPELGFEQVSSLSGYSSNSSSFKNALSKLRTLDLIDGSKIINLSEAAISAMWST